MSANGFTRYRRILDSFTDGHSIWTVQDLAASLGVSVSTLYRQVRELVEAGFLESTVDAQYRLGPAFVEFDRRVRLSDPLMRAGEVVLPQLLRRLGPGCAALLARLYGGKVMCVADRHSPPMPLKSSYERGLPMPLTRGATSRAVLSVIETRRLRRLLATEGVIGDAAAQVLADSAEIRRRGYVVATGEVDPGIVGLAVPLHHRDAGIEASLSVIVTTDNLTPTFHNAIIAALNVAAADLNQRIGAGD